MDQRFAHALEQKNLVFIMGTGVSAALSGGAEHATWKGLIDFGIDRVLSVTKSDQWASLIRGNLDFAFGNGDMALLLATASAVEGRIKQIGDYAFAKWLEDSVGQLSVVDGRLADAISAIPFPILTTNYDQLIESRGRNWAHWQETTRMQRILAGSSNEIGHLHGVWDVPGSVVFSESSYRGLLDSESAQQLQKAASTTKSMVYVGYGSGLEDPNFGNLINWHRSNFVPSGVTHFRLCLEDQVGQLEADHANDQIHVIPYGKKREDLAAFLEGVSGGLATAPVSNSGIVRDVIGDAQVGFAEELKSDSIIAEQKANIDGCALDDVVVPPVVLPVPQAELVRQRSSDSNPKSLDRLDALQESAEDGVLILVSSSENSGLSTALKWLVLHAATERGNQVPLFVSFPKCKAGFGPLEDQIRRDAQLRGVISERNAPLPPYVLAIDDFTPNVDPVSDRVLNELQALVPSFTVIGCRQGVESTVVERLEQLGIRSRVRYLGRLTAADVRHFARLASPANQADLAQQVIDVLTHENLPRTPSTVSLLLSVLQRNALSSNASQTSILNDYVGLLLGRGDPSEDARLGMDQSNREAILGAFAQRLVDEDAGGLTPDEAESAVRAHLKRLGWDEDERALIKDLIEKKILKQDGKYIGFARAAYVHLFVAKRAEADPEFRARLLERAIFFAPAIADYAALSRHDADLLREMATLLDPGKWDSSKSGIFEEVEDTAVIEVVDPEGRGAVVIRNGAHRVEKDRIFDAANDDDPPPFPVIDERYIPPAIMLMRVLELVSNVLRDSDQVEDLVLKQQLLESVLSHWSMLMSHINQDQSFREFLRGLLGIDESTEEGAEALDAWAKTIPAAITLGGVTATLASRKLLVALGNILDRLASADTANDPDTGEERDIGIIFLIFVVKERGWSNQIRKLIAPAHRSKLWVVRNFLFHSWWASYLEDAMDDEERSGLLELILDVYQKTITYTGAQQQAHHRVELKQYYERRRLDHVQQLRLATPQLNALDR